MPGVGIGVYDGYAGVLHAGEEVSSTYEGRHITVLESELIHPNHLAAGVNLVQKGDPVIICNTGVPANRGRAVGVALATATAATDLIAIDTEGIWQLPVSSYTDGAVGSAIVAGDPLYIHDESLAAAGALGLGDALISKIRNLVTQIPFGYALGTMVAAGTGTIAVKVHWDPSLDTQDQMFKTVTSGAYNYGKQWVGLLEAGESTGVAGAFFAQIDGVQTGHIYGWKAWVEPQDTFDGTGGSYLLVGADLGFYEGGGGADLTSNRVVGLQLQYILSQNPANLYHFRVNVAAAAGAMDAIFAAANPTSLGYSAGTAGTGVVGTIPFADIVGHGIVYIDVHAAVA